MSDMAYIMETQDPHELWLVEGDNKFKVSRDMYWLLASKGADLPPTHHITELLTENAKLREYMREMHDHIKDCCDCCDEWYCSEWDEDNECCRFDTMMRTCGIEVPS